MVHRCRMLMDSECQDHDDHFRLQVRLQWSQALEPVHRVVLGGVCDELVDCLFGVLVSEVVPTGWECLLLRWIPFVVDPLERRPRCPSCRFGRIRFAFCQCNQFFWCISGKQSFCLLQSILQHHCTASTTELSYRFTKLHRKT